MQLDIYGNLFLINTFNTFIKRYRRFFYALGSYWEEKFTTAEWICFKSAINQKGFRKMLEGQPVTIFCKSHYNFLYNLPRKNSVLGNRKWFWSCWFSFGEVRLESIRIRPSLNMKRRFLGRAKWLFLFVLPNKYWKGVFFPRDKFSTSQSHK